MWFNEFAMKQGKFILNPQLHVKSQLYLLLPKGIQHDQNDRMLLFFGRSDAVNPAFELSHKGVNQRIHVLIRSVVK